MVLHASGFVDREGQIGSRCAAARRGRQYLSAEIEADDRDAPREAVRRQRYFRLQGRQIAVAGRSPGAAAKHEHAVGEPDCRRQGAAGGVRAHIGEANAAALEMVLDQTKKFAVRVLDNEKGPRWREAILYQSFTSLPSARNRRPFAIRYFWKCCFA